MLSVAIYKKRILQNVLILSFCCWCCFSFLPGAGLLVHKLLWENRLLGDIGMTAKVSWDGVDYRTNEVRPLWNGNFSFKHHGAGVKYDIGLNIQTGDIVWIGGPYRCGLPDSTLFKKSGVIDYLEEGEMLEGDTHYKNNLPQYFLKHAAKSLGDRQASTVEARHETVNKRMRQFNILSHGAFRHGIDKHANAFRAVAVLTQVNMKHGHRLFQVEYNYDILN
jgi:hypothetical protein